MPLSAFLGWISAQRLYELWLSARHTRTLIARGAVEHDRARYPWIVALHVVFPIALAVEVLALGARPPRAWALWLTLLVLADMLRAWTMLTLGEHWTTRVWVVPGTTPVRNGPYRWMRHPNYLAVTLELLAAPLMFGAWRTAVACLGINAVLLAGRIRAEERALRIASNGVRTAHVP